MHKPPLGLDKPGKHRAFPFIPGVFEEEAGAQIRKRTDTRGKNVRAHKTKKRLGKQAAILKEVS